MIRNIPAIVAVLAVLTGTPFSVTQTKAADLGGDCCADLEERIAELEATTARKGNRKLSLKLSGYVNEAVMWWDDGQESNVYVVTNDSGRTRLRFRGKAKIDYEWEAGYRLEFGFRSNRSDRVDQFTPTFGPRIDVRYSLWYLKSKTWGQVLVGRTESAAQNVTEVNVTQTASIAKNSDVEDWAAGFQLVASGLSGLDAISSVEWRRLVNDDFIQPGEGNRIMGVQYVSPKFRGFWLESSWGQDDYWDVGLWYKGTHHNMKIAAALTYGEFSDTLTLDKKCIVSGAELITLNSDDADCRQIGGSFSALHEPTGLFLTFGAGWFRDELISESITFAGTGADDDSTYYAFQSGIEKGWHPLGKTTVYGEWFQHFGGANDRTISVDDSLNTQIGPNFGPSNIWKSEMRVYGGGIIQGIDAAAMRLYLGWRHYEADVRLRQQSLDGVASGPIVNSPIRDLDVVMGGAIIKF